MTKTSKRLISVLICLTLVLAMLPMTVFAADDTITVYFENNWNWSDVCAYYWGGSSGSGDWPGVPMTLVEGTIYSVEIPADTTGLIFNGVKDDGSGNRDQSPNIENSEIQTGVCYYMAWDNGNQYRTYEYSPSDGGETTEAVYTVAGDTGLCGVNWDPSKNPMSLNASTGLYEITFANVAKGTYGFKVTDGSWANSWGDNSQNYTFTVSSACDVTITFNADSKEITVSGRGVGSYVFDPQSITAVGAGSGNFLNGASWDVAYKDNHLTEVSDGVWSITYNNVEAGTYEFKFAANDAWTDSWGTGSAIETNTAVDFYYNGNNTTFTIDKLSNVTLTLDLSAFDYSTKNGAKCTVTTEEVSTVVPGAADIKWQMTAGTTATSGSTNVRFLTSVDSLDYKNVTFTIAIGDETPYTYNCTAVYEKLNADGQVIERASDVFGDGAAYFVAFTMENMPAAHFDKEITVTVTWYDMDGEVAKTAERTIVVADAL